MPETTDSSAKPLHVLFIHFDVGEHHLKADTFLDTVSLSKHVFEALARTFDIDSENFEAVVLPPEPGTFLAKVAWTLITLSGVSAAALKFFESDIGERYIFGLTGHEPTYWAERAGEVNRRQIDASTEFAERVLSALPDGVEDAQTADAEVCETALLVLTEMVKGILSKDSSVIEKLDGTSGILRDAVEARVEFYQACMKDSEVKALGFEDSQDFPIPRSDFPARATVRLPTPVDDGDVWQVVEEVIAVTSPNWDKDDQSTRNWKGKDSLKKDCYFTIEDEEFWSRVKSKGLTVEVLDQLKVQSALRIRDARVKQRRVLRVLEFNGQVLSKALEKDALSAILGEFETFRPVRREPDLFSG